jgi:hypothetical protein
VTAVSHAPLRGEWNRATARKWNVHACFQSSWDILALSGEPLKTSLLAIAEAK